MRKIYLLHRNQSVTKSKKTIAELRRMKKFKSVQFAMIPIYDTKTCYMAVDGDFLETLSFTRAEIKYHLTLQSNGLLGPDRTDEEIYDYCPVRIDVNTVEALYNCLHNIFAYHYVRDLIKDDGHVEKSFYLLVTEVEITLYDGKHVSDRFHVVIDNPEEIPFDIDDVGYTMLTSIAKHYGISGFNSTRGVYGYNITLRDRESGKIWREERHNIELFSDISHVFIASPFTWSYLLVKDNEYDQILRMNNAMLHMLPMDLTAYSIEPEHPHLPMLTPTTFLGVPKYDMCDGYDYPPFSEEIAVNFTEAVIEIFPYMIMDGEDIAVAIEYLGIILKTYHEMAKVYVAEQRDSHDLQPFCLVTSAVADMAIDLDHRVQAPSDMGFHIYTDVYQDKLPNIKEVCYLLAVQEKSK